MPQPTRMPAPVVAAAAPSPAGPFGGADPRTNSLSRRLLFIASNRRGLRSWAAATAFGKGFWPRYSGQTTLMMAA